MGTPIVILVSPTIFIMAGRYMEEDTTKALLLLGVGVVLMAVGVIQCDMRSES